MVYDPNTSITSNSTILSATDTILTTDSTVLFINADTTIKDHLKKHQKEIGKISLGAGIMLNLNTTLGAGLFNLPFVFYNSGGFITSIFIQLLILTLIIGSFFILTYCTNKSKSNTYHQMIDKTLGKRWSNVCVISVVLLSYGACLTFLLLITDQFKTFLSSFYGENFSSIWYLNSIFTTSICSIIFILPMCFTKGIEFLKYPSSCGVFILGYLILMIFIKYFQTEKSYPVNDAPLTHWTKVFESIPAICFSYQCHINWVPTYAAMNSKVKSFKTISTIIISTMCCAIAYTFVSYMGIATFGGQNLHVDLIQNYNAKDNLVLIGIIAFAFKIIFTYPIVLFSAREAIVDFILERKKIDANAIDEPTIQLIKTLRYSIVIIWFFSSLVVAELVPDIGYVINMLGTLAILFIFILPGLCLIQVAIQRDEFLETKKSLILYTIASVFIIFGVFIFGLGLTSSLQQFF